MAPDTIQQRAAEPNAARHTARGAVVASEDRCDACTHPLSAHDALGNRFCAATTATALTRGCICG
ncbi:RGCVC family protein [Saccharothrix yanglingensis]|nr:RGCVC family protein [Saccharothrix yanglingensis]